mmetsp:Transcript_20133/g.19098  ORF Transcript_20133/g.19098 Transcript_20133/m.19098 type:complete len:100 (+) Transcript_20133:42-341(+)
MKARTLLGVFFLLSLSAIVEGKNNCQIDFYDYDYDDWYDLGNGLILGLYRNPPSSINNCRTCRNFARAMGDLNEGLVYTISLADTWLDKDAILDENVLT